MPKPAAALIFNPAAGGGPLDTVQVERLLQDRFTLELIETKLEETAEACTRQALARGAELVIAAGGDGTVSAVAAALVGSAATLGVIPQGTANSFAAALEIPDALNLAIETILEGDTVTVDTARANGRPMILHASIGFHAAVVGGTSGEAKSRWGVLAYLATAVEKLNDSAEFHAHIQSDTRSLECRANNITVASLAPPQTLLAQGPTLLLPDDGTLDVTIVAASGLAEVVATGIHLLRSATQEQAATRDNVGYFPCSRVQIDTDPPQPLLVDGESAGEGRLVVECIPRSLRVKVPKTAAWRSKVTGGEEKLEGLPALRVHE
jgi:YegS/Rv2252/BmrU family lipid kinase